MPLNHPPTAAAMRAAKRLENSNVFSLHAVAEIIDEETNVRELTEALEMLLATDNGSEMLPTSTQVAQAHAALQKARTT